MLVTVYRYERPDGRGAYRTTHYVDPVEMDVDTCMNAKHSWNDLHLPWQGTAWADYEGNLSDIDPVLSLYIAGCPTLADLRLWFQGWEDVLKRDGLVIAEHTVPAENVLYSTRGLKQVAFLPADTERYNHD